MQQARSLTNSDCDYGNVVLSAEDAYEVARLLRVLRASAGRTSSELKDQALDVIAERSRRTQHFGRAMFGEPAWDMLLQLYVSDRGCLAARDLVLVTEESKSTARRWIDYLEGKGLIRRLPHPVDRRQANIELLECARELLDAYFSGSPRSRVGG